MIDKPWEIMDLAGKIAINIGTEQGLVSLTAELYQDPDYDDRLEDVETKRLVSIGQLKPTLIVVRAEYDGDRAFETVKVLIRNLTDAKYAIKDHNLIDKAIDKLTELILHKQRYYA